MIELMVKYIYIIIGTISLILGLIGIVTPGLPTTPFILLTAFLYSKGSTNLHKKLLEHRLTGHYINRINKGLSVKARLLSIAFMWTMISFTIFVVFKNIPKLQITMAVLGVIGTIVQFIVLGKRKKKKKTEKLEDVEDSLDA